MKVKIHPHIIKQAMSSKEAQNNEQLMNWINKDMEKMIDYYEHVYNMPQRLQLWKFHCDIDDYQNRVMELDRQRRDKHNEAISALIDLNSCCRQAGTLACVDVGGVQFFTTDEDIRSADRTDIADSIFEFCGNWIQSTNSTYSPQARKTQINDKMVEAQTLAEEKGLATGAEEFEPVKE